MPDIDMDFQDDRRSELLVYVLSKYDILDYDQKVFKIKNNNDFIYIPHPRLHQRNFVLLPLFEISKTWIYPKKNKKISDLLNNLGSNNLRTIKLI